MRSGIAGLTALIVLLAVVIVGFNAIFTVMQTQQALVLRFGEPVGGVVTEPGLHFKTPFIETVVLLENRLLDVEMPHQEVLLADTNRLDVDAFARYRIVNPLLFYQTVNSNERADNQLASLLNSAVRNVLGDATLLQILREEREALMARIRDQVNAQGAALGVNVVDVRIRHADLPQEVSEKVYDRMRTEYQRQAAKIRGEGNQQALTIRANADREVTVLKADAQQQADQIRGAGDAERNRIFAEAFGKDPDFFAFYRAMQAYDAGLKPNQTNLVLSPTSDFFRFFNGPGSAPNTPGGAPAPATPPAQSPAPSAPKGSGP